MLYNITYMYIIYMCVCKTLFICLFVSSWCQQFRIINEARANPMNLYSTSMSIHLVCHTILQYQSTGEHWFHSRTKSAGITWITSICFIPNSHLISHEYCIQLQISAGQPCTKHSSHFYFGLTAKQKRSFLQDWGTRKSGRSPNS